MDDLAFRVAFSFAPGVGPGAWRRLEAAYGSGAAAWAASATSLSACLGPPLADAVVAHRSVTTPERCLAAVAAAEAVALTPGDPRYPPLLKEVARPPFVLYATGQLDALRAPCAAVVGTRRPTPDGGRAARRLAGDLAACGVTVVSGMALGIDGEAHGAALDAGGTTVAVLACGVDVTYPRRHAALMRRIVSEGAVVSEFPPGMEPLRRHFPSRNRIIAGASKVTVVVEAGMPSGALITAGLALDEGRAVCAVPGSIFSDSSRGTLELLRNGATPVASAAHVLEAMGIEAPPAAVGPAERPGVARLAPEARRILAALDHASATADELARTLALAPAVVARGLSTLEIAGLARRDAGCGWSAER